MSSSPSSKPWRSPPTSRLQATAQLDGCSVAETDLNRAQADAQTVHGCYKDLALVERDFITLKTGHLEWRPWFVFTEDNTQAHPLTAMPALKVRRHLEQGLGSLEVTVEEGLRQLDQICVIGLVHAARGKVVARQVLEPSGLRRQLLEALKLKLLTTVPEAKVTLGTQKKIALARKSRVKQGPSGDFEFEF